VIGFDPRARSWVTRAQADTQASAELWEDVPKLDGILLQDKASRQDIAVDWGNMFHQIPAAVLRPGSVGDVVAIVRFANRHALNVAMKGQGHSRYGQTQAEAGIVIDSSTMNRVEPVIDRTIDAEAGAFWGDVAKVSLAKELIPPVMPDTMSLSVGGTLSAGGLGATSQHFGAQVDNVRELDVVTGNGELITCSPEHESELFDMVLAGMGQCGLIVRVRLALMSARSHVMRQGLIYDDLDAYLADQHRLAVDGRFDHQDGFARWENGKWTFILQVGCFYTPPDEPDLTAMTLDLRPVSRNGPVRLAQWDYLQRMAQPNAAAEKILKGGDPMPGIAMWIPVSATREFAASFLALPPERAKLSIFSFWPVNTRRFTKPLFKVPAEDVAFTMWLRWRVAPGDQALSALLESNQALLARMTAVGGKRYPPYSMIIPRSEWAEHFGPDVWHRFTAAKQRFDPNGALTPGAKIFA
jgi:cytokinin dehydrogenase